MSIYDPIARALGIEPIELPTITADDHEPGNTKGSQAYNHEANKINASKGGKAKAAKKYPAWNKNLRGMIRSFESVTKQKETITGKKRCSYKNYNHEASSKSVVINGKKYPSVSAAMRDTRSSYYTIMKLQRTPQPSQEHSLSEHD